MPIKREHRDRYPIDFAEIAFLIKDANLWVCQSCNQLCRRPGEPFDTHRRTLTIAHADSVYDAPEVLLLALCAPCHLRYDAAAHAAARRRTRYAQRRQAGQTTMLRLAHNELSRADWQELADCWPSLDDALGLDDGVDFWAEFPVVGEAI